MPDLISVNGKIETLFSPHDFRDIIDRYIGSDAAKYFEEFIVEFEVLQSENAELKKEVAELETKHIEV